MPLPKSVNPESMHVNKELFDFELSAAGMELIDMLPNFGFSGMDPEQSRSKEFLDSQGN